jgi:hypothetical protein
MPKTGRELEQLIMDQLRATARCEKAIGVVVVPASESSGASWTVKSFISGESDAHRCDLALQRIVPHYQQLYELTTKGGLNRAEHDN